MKTRLQSLPGARKLLCLASLLLAAPVIVTGQSEKRGPVKLKARTARVEIGAAYEAWGAACVALDRETLAAMLHLRFQVLL